MRKTLLFVFALLFATMTMAQNRAVFVSESFDGSSMPAGWSIAGLGTSNWSISPTNNAGGQANELHMTWDPQFNGISRVVLPAVDLTNISSVMVSFKHALDNYSGSHTIGIATSSDDGTTWNVGWSQNYNSNNSWSVMQELTTADMGHANVRFCLYYSGNSYNMNEWYFDDIQIFALENTDLGITSINLPSFIPNGEQAVGFKVMNYGVTPITGIEATYEVEGFEPVTETFTEGIASTNTLDLEFTTPIDLNPGDYHLTITLNAVNGGDDDDLNNNTLSKDFTVACAYAERIPMIEHFSSSTCAPCVQPNIQMHNFCNNNEGRYTYTKYQMNWPGNGDPYYTAEGGTRRTYYGISAVPMAFMDAEVLNFSNVQNTFNQHAERTAFVDIRGSFAVDGNSISVEADITSYIDIEARVFISVNEKTTTGNVGSNGETSFHHVFMKMLTNAQGSSIALTAGEVKHLEFTQNLSSTHVEEMSDLEVAIWVQNYASKEIYNSHYAYEYTDIHPYPVENLVCVHGINAYTASWDAPTQGNPIGYNVYVNNELVAENITETSYSFTGNPGVLYVAGVVALYPDNHSSIKTVAIVDESTQDLGLEAESESYTLDENSFAATLRVTNANDNSHSDITILSIEEVNPEGVQYLTIIHDELPYTLHYNEDFYFTIAPNIVGASKSIVQTTIVLTSDVGVLEFLVSLDGEILSVTEASAKANIYPNPANASVCVEAESGIESVSVYNVLGALVETIPANAKSVNVNLSNYSNGIYFFNIRQSDGTVSNQRVMVCH